MVTKQAQTGLFIILAMVLIGVGVYFGVLIGLTINTAPIKEQCNDFILEHFYTKEPNDSFELPFNASGGGWIEQYNNKS